MYNLYNMISEAQGVVSPLAVPLSSAFSLTLLGHLSS